jgi:hypothetical protein
VRQEAGGGLVVIGERAASASRSSSLRKPGQAASELADNAGTGNGQHAGILPNYGVDLATITGKPGSKGKRSDHRQPTARRSSWPGTWAPVLSTTRMRVRWPWPAPLAVRLDDHGR